MIKVLAILGSPRRGANSETLLDKAASGIKNAEIKKIAASELNIAPCDGCFSCRKTGECAIKDDMQQVYKELLGADCLLIASPVYFKGPSCQIKCLIDRCNALWARKYVLGKSNAVKPKIGVAILTCASSGVKDMFTGSISIFKAFIRTLDAEYRGEFLAEGLEIKDAALKDEALLKRAAEFGKKLI
ncbi:MAG: flavodoxin family protein [Candidatus Omnitrophica bacterium]|nr:flavodoxin family protein [Candidatus Omnitrophota bacterium]